MWHTSMSKSANVESWHRLALRACTVSLIVLMSCSSSSERKFELTSLGLRDNIPQFYSDVSVPIETKKDGVRWQAVLTELDELKAVAPVPIVAASPAQ